MSLIFFFFFIAVYNSMESRCVVLRFSSSRFAGSNPADVDGFFQDVKIPSTSSLGGTLSWGSESEISGSLKNLKSEKIYIHVLVIPKFGEAQ